MQTNPILMFKLIENVIDKVDSESFEYDFTKGMLFKSNKSIVSEIAEGNTDSHCEIFSTTITKTRASIDSSEYS